MQTLLSAARASVGAPSNAVAACVVRCVAMGIFGEVRTQPVSQELWRPFMAHYMRHVRGTRASPVPSRPTYLGFDDGGLDSFDLQARSPPRLRSTDNLFSALS